MGKKSSAGRSRPFSTGVLTVVALAFFLPTVPSVSTQAEAQEYRRQQSRGLLDLLFGGNRQREQTRRPARGLRRAVPPGQVQRGRAAAPLSRNTVSGRASRPAAPPPPPAVEKLENARIVLVIGDFLASGLAEGLEAAYAQSPGVEIVDRTKGSSGFVRDDYYDWNAEIEPILDEVKPAVAVVMIGSNDRQQLLINGRREDPRTPAWLEEYNARVAVFAHAIREKDIPVIWTGLPPFKSQSMSSDMLAFNDIYKTTAEAIDGAFVDIWDGFVDENGAFIFSGPDMNGQPARLRGSDGINLTRSGKRKVAFYTEKPLNKLLGDAIAPDIGEQGMENLSELSPFLEPHSETPIDRTQPISLTSPDLDGGEMLLGEVVKPVEAEAAEEGEADSKLTGIPSKPGRADYFTSPRRSVVETR